MDPLSITTGCIALAGTITKVSVSINSFVRTARDARSDLDSVSRELGSLQTVLELLAEDTQEAPRAIPANLEKQICGIVSNCSRVVENVDKSIQKHKVGKMGSVRWAWSGKEEMATFRLLLESHKSSLELALDMVAISMTRETKNDTTNIKNDTTETKASNEAIKEAIKETIKQDTAQILAEIERLRAQLGPEEGGTGSSGVMLQRYLDELTSYAETVADGSHEYCDDDYLSACSGRSSPDRLTGLDPLLNTPRNLEAATANGKHSRQFTQQTAMRPPSTRSNTIGVRPSLVAPTISAPAKDTRKENLSQPPAFLWERWNCDDEYKSDNCYEPTRELRKSKIDSTLEDLRLRGAVRALIGKARSRSRSGRSRRESFESDRSTRSKARSEGGGGDDKKWQQAAKAAVVAGTVESGRIRKEPVGFTGTMATDGLFDAGNSTSSDRLDLEMPNVENSPYKAIKVNKPSDDSLSASSNQVEPEALNAGYSALLDESPLSEPPFESRPSPPEKEPTSPKEGLNPTPPTQLRLEVQYSAALTNRQLERRENEGRKGEVCPMAIPMHAQIPGEAPTGDRAQPRARTRGEDEVTEDMAKMNLERRAALRMCDERCAPLLAPPPKVRERRPSLPALLRRFEERRAARPSSTKPPTLDENPDRLTGMNAKAIDERYELPDLSGSTNNLYASVVVPVAVKAISHGKPECWSPLQN